MTKKTDQKSKVKGADAEEKVLKKIQQGDYAAKKNKQKSEKKYQSEGGAKDTNLGKRTYGDKSDKKKQKNGNY